MNLTKLITDYGYVNLPIDSNIDIKEEIIKLKKEKNAVILGHYYIKGELQDLSDFVGDSLGLSQEASKTKADIIVFMGVHFMAETAKIICPDKKVILPDLNAGCSLSENTPAKEFCVFIRQFPQHIVVSYINCSAEIKALSDVICTSANALKIIESFPKEQKIIFAPDKNLGDYLNRLTERNMILWNATCMVHEKYSLEKILELKKEYPEAKFIAHPECERPVLMIADFIGSTTELLKYTQTSDAKTFIVATESGIFHQMKKISPEKTFIPAPAQDATCGCNDCSYMKLNTIEKLYNCLKYELPEIILSEEIIKKAKSPIEKMLKISQK